MAREMSREEWRAFVMEGTRTAKVAVVRRDGSPSVAPVWELLIRLRPERITTDADVAGY